MKSAYSAEPAADCLPVKSSVGKRYSTSKKTKSAKRCFAVESEMVVSTTPQSSLMCEGSTEKISNRTSDWLDALPSSSQEARHASQRVWLENGKAKVTNDFSGGTPFALLESSGRNGHFLKTPQASLRFGTQKETSLSEKYSGDWPRWVMMRSRSLFRLRKRARNTDVTVFGFLPTPTVSKRSNRSDSPNASYRPSLFELVQLATPKASRGHYQYSGGDHSKIVPTLLGQVRMTLPTPTVESARSHGKNDADRHTPSLYHMTVASLPTPRASENENRQTKLSPSQRNGKHGLNLSAAVNMIPTPCVRGLDGSSHVRAAHPDLFPTPTMRDSHSRGQAEANRNSLALNHVATNGNASALNPAFEEIMMGWPLNWSATDFDKAEFEYWIENFRQWFSENVIIQTDAGLAAIRRVGSDFEVVALGVKESESGDSARREAIGLGIVPQSMVAAWEIMTEKIIENFQKKT